MNILVVHKAASSLLKRIANYTNDLYGEQKLKFFRIQNERIVTYDEYTKGPYVIIIRHPLNKLISEYYSFGWTHYVATDLQNKLRNKIRNMTLEEFVVFHQKSVYCYEKIFKHGQNIIKYENMMDHPKNFIRLLLKPDNLDNFVDNVYDQFKSEFEFIKDKSDDIIKGNYKIATDIVPSDGHRRTLDHAEYQKKLPNTIYKNLKGRTIQIIKNYNDSKCILGDK